MQCARRLVEALHTPCPAFTPTPAALPRPQLTNPSPLGSTQAPRAPRTVPPSLAICMRSAVAIDPASDVPAHLEGAAVIKLGPLAPRSDAPRTTRLRTPRRDPGRGGRQHLQPATLTMPSQLSPLTTFSSPRVLHAAPHSPADALRDGRRLQ